MSLDPFKENRPTVATLAVYFNPDPMVSLAAYVWRDRVRHVAGSCSLDRRTLLLLPCPSCCRREEKISTSKKLRDLVRKLTVFNILDVR